MARDGDESSADDEFIEVDLDLSDSLSDGFGDGFGGYGDLKQSFLDLELKGMDVELCMYSVISIRQETPYATLWY